VIGIYPDSNPMTDRKKPGVAFWTTLAVVVVLVAAYSIAYVEMVQPEQGVFYDLTDSR